MRRLVLGLAGGLVGFPLAVVAAEPGETVVIPEGWYRVEPEGTVAQGQLSILVVRPEPRLHPRPPDPAEVAAAREAAFEPPAARSEPREDPCRPHRARYAEILFRMAGIWDAPWALDFLEAMDGSASLLSPWIQFNLFGLPAPILLPSLAPGVDPLRPLAWDADLRRAAKDLAACVRKRDRRGATQLH
nr:MAG: hypothetical protein DIU72_06710 [Pseudomonadota bacterium]